ncbi:MAG: septum formation inhibitor Maf [Deltaproteobacteria bacterium]|nr:septum formation inhibitor Maf [Deltaproteobacteria bacterium]
MQKHYETPELILASKSPRRKYLLEQAGLAFSIIPSNIDEEAIDVPDPESRVKILAEKKATDIAEKYPDSWVIGADTIVFIRNTVLGKPNSKEDARNMLKQLSNQTHQVFTGYSVCCKAADHFFSDTVKTDVLFKNLSEEEIEWYIHTDEPFDKAGAYAIQGLGTFLVRRINGSYTNVVGLPVCEVIEHLITSNVVKMKSHQ